MKELIAPIAVGIVVPLILAGMARARYAAKEQKDFIVLELTCSKCGHRAALLKPISDPAKAAEMLSQLVNPT